VFSKKDKLKRRIRARMQVIKNQKLKKEDKFLRAQQKELRDYLLHRKEKPKAVGFDEIVNLADRDDSPFMYIQGAVLWNGLKKSWMGYKIGKRFGQEGGDPEEQRRQKECAIKIQTLQELLRVDVDDFTHIGISKED
jgi:hypothetical protein